MRVGSWIAERLAQHDVLCSVGGDLFTLSLPPTVELVPKHLRIIHLDVDPWELGKNFPADVAILADPKATLPELTGQHAASGPGALGAYDLIDQFAS